MTWSPLHEFSYYTIEGAYYVAHLEHNSLSGGTWHVRVTISEIDGPTASATWKMTYNECGTRDLVFESRSPSLSTLDTTPLVMARVRDFDIVCGMAYPEVYFDGELVYDYTMRQEGRFYEVSFQAPELAMGSAHSVTVVIKEVCCNLFNEINEVDISWTFTVGCGSARMVANDYGPEGTITDTQPVIHARFHDADTACPLEAAHVNLTHPDGTTESLQAAANLVNDHDYYVSASPGTTLLPGVYHVETTLRQTCCDLGGGQNTGTARWSFSILSPDEMKLNGHQRLDGQGVNYDDPPLGVYLNAELVPTLVSYNLDASGTTPVTAYPVCSPQCEAPDPTTWTAEADVSSTIQLDIQGAGADEHHTIPINAGTP